MKIYLLKHGTFLGIKFISILATVLLISCGAKETTETDSTGTTETDPTPTPTAFSVNVTSPETPANLNSTVTVQFNNAIDCNSVTPSTFYVDSVAGAISCSGDTISFSPGADLFYSTTYTVTAVGGIDGITDNQSTPGLLSSNHTWTFTTMADPSPLPGTMILPTIVGGSELFRYPHIQAESSNKIAIVWGTASSGTGQLQYMPESGNTWITASSTEQAFPSFVTGIGADFYQQVATLNGLTPGTKYRYNIIHDGLQLATDVPFKTLPGSSNSQVSFIVFGDSGIEYNEPRDVRDRIAMRAQNGNYIYPHDFIVGVGDIAYYGGTYFEFDYRFFDQMSGKGDRGDGLNSILATRSFVPALGNHEFPNQNARAIPAAYIDSFVLPEMAGIPGEDTERYYSFDAGNAHVVVLDSMKFAGNNRLAEMLSWLSADLNATDRTWKVVFFHHTIFSVGSHGTYGDQVANERMRKQLAPVLQQYGVQLVVFGHDHLYQRSKRIRVDANGMIVRDADCQVVDSTSGIVYVVAGIGGTDLRARELQPADCGTALYNQHVNDYGDGYDFVAIDNNGDPVIYDDNSSGFAPTFPANRHGFVQVSIDGGNLTLNTYNYDGVLFDTYTMPAN